MSMGFVNWFFWGPVIYFSMTFAIFSFVPPEINPLGYVLPDESVYVFYGSLSHEEYG
jgi:hypothetical protein